MFATITPSFKAMHLVKTDSWLGTVVTVCCILERMQKTISYYGATANTVSRGMAVAVHKQLLGAIGESWASGETQCQESIRGMWLTSEAKVLPLPLNPTPQYMLLR